MRYLLLCSGIEAASAAWLPLGWTPVAFAEIDPFASAVLACRYPHVANLGDIRRYREWNLGAVDLLVAGTPCFPAGTLIATEHGFVPIEKVRAGDMALTHHGRFRRVLRTGSKIAPTVVVRGQGHFGMVTTAGHPFYARRKTGHNTRLDGHSIRLKEITEPDWIRADCLAHCHWACVSRWPQLDWERPSPIGRELPVEISDENLFALAGAYLGDGWARINRRRGYVLLGVNPRKLELLRPVLDELRAYSVAQMRTSVRIQIPSRPLARWLADHFGCGAAAKRVPMWALGLHRELRDALIWGYQITDGCHSSTSSICATTISRELALTMRALSVSTGYASSVRLDKRSPLSVIEGRVVHQHDNYTISFSRSDRSSFEDGGFRWQCVRSVALTGREEQVFDLEVDEDHSYVADGIAVHNCPSFSIAGKRAGLDDPRGQLAFVWLAVARRHAPRWVLWENVPGVLSTNGGRDFGTLLGALADLGYGYAWRVLDAQYFGLAQRRRRVFLVGCAGNQAAAAAVLFERASLLGHPAPRRSARQDIAGTLAARTRGGSGLGTDTACDGGLIPDVARALTSSNERIDAESETLLVARPLRSQSNLAHREDMDTLIAHSLNADGFDASEDGTGRGTPLVPVEIAHALTTQSGGITEDGTGRGSPLVPVAFDCTTNGRYGFSAGEIAGTLRREAHTNGHTAVAQAVAFAQNQRDEARFMPVTGALSGEPGARQQSYVFAVRGRDDGRNIEVRTDDLANALVTPNGGRDGVGVGALMTPAMQVRRLTPREAERLMGFPDDYTLVPYRGKPAADGPRYRALGNSIAVPVLAWIAQRIAAVDELLG